MDFFSQNFEDQEHDMNSQLCMCIEIEVCKMLLCKSLQKCGMHSYEVTNRVWTIRNVNYALYL